MWRLHIRVHGQQHPALQLSVSFARLRHSHSSNGQSIGTWTGRLALVGHRRKLAACTIGAPRWLNAGATPFQSPLVQDQTNGAQSLHEASSSEEQELRILDRAQAFGVTTLEDLLRQCAFQDESSRPTRLVSRKPYSRNLELWCILLDFQMLRFGERGVRKLWHVMRDSGGRVDDFFYGPLSDHFWAALIAAGLKDHSFLRQLCRHELKWGAKRPSLFVDVVGGLLADNQPGVAFTFAQELQDSHPVTSDDANKLFMQACHAGNNSALPNFLHVYKTFQKVCLYSRAVPYLCNQHRFADAWTVHKFLLSRGDLPSDFASVEPLVIHIASTKSSFEEFLQDLKGHNVGYESQAHRVKEHEKGFQYGIASGTLNIVNSRTMGVQPSRLSDKFVARAFATKAFSFDFILRGLRLLGLREIGPLGLRQISVTAGPLSELRRRLKLLKELGIDHGSSMYARAVTGLAAQGRVMLLSDILASDQHPDVFEDLDLQEKLLAQYYRNSDWRQANRTLAILQVGNQEFFGGERLTMQETSFNVLLRSVIRLGDWSLVSKIIARVKYQGCRLSTCTLRCMHDSILSRRQPGRKPELNNRFDDVGFLLSLYQNAKASGIQVPPTFWREPIRRLGILGRWNDVERMLFWLAATYTPHSAGFHRLVVHREEYSISRIFSPSLQHAVVAWAFLNPKPRRALHGTLFRLGREDRQLSRTFIEVERGVRVLRMLQDQYGVPIDEATVRKACLWGLRKRFAPDYFSGRLVRDNAHHKYSLFLLPDVLQRLNTAWSCSLFDVESAALQKHILLPRRIRRLRQRGRPSPGDRNMQTQPRRGEAPQCDIRPEGDEDLRDVTAEYQAEMDASRAKASTGADHVEDIVMYRDIYNISLEDYGGSDADNKHKDKA